MEQLWDLLLKAQESPNGIPDKLIARELKQKGDEKQIAIETKRKLEKIKLIG